VLAAYTLDKQNAHKVIHIKHIKDLNFIKSPFLKIKLWFKYINYAKTKAANVSFKIEIFLPLKFKIIRSDTF
jgi:hypothetical protein